METHQHRKNETAGRVIYRRWRFGDFEYVSDLIAHDYMRRWVFRTPWFAIRLHHILRGDKDRHPHDHPMRFASLILWGGYVEYRPGQPPRAFLPGDMNVCKATDLHRLELIGKSAWTLVFAGPYYRNWGLQTEDGWVPAGEYDAWLAKRGEKRET